MYVIAWGAAPLYAVISFAGPSSEATGAFSKSSAKISCAGAGTPGTAWADGVPATRKARPMIAGG